MNRKLTTAQFVLYGSLAVILTGIVLMSNFKPASSELSVIPEKAVRVSTLQVHLTNTADVVFLPALIQANVNAILSAEKAGRIVKLSVDRGDAVERGQILLQIDDRIWQANLKQAQIAARDAEKNFARFQALQKEGAVAASEYDQIEKAAITAESMLETAKVNIEQCRVVSPIRGTVNDRFIEAGEYVRPGTPVFQVVDHATLKVVLQIPEKDIFSIHLGDKISFSVQPLAGQKFVGTVKFVATQADERNNSFRTELVVDNAEGTLRPGMIARVEFHRGIQKNMVSLPMSAVLPSKGDHIVYLVQDQHAVRRKVQLETMTRERALISAGLEEGELVVVEGARTLSDGQRVEIQPSGIAQ